MQAAVNMASATRIKGKALRMSWILSLQRPALALLTVLFWQATGSPQRLSKNVFDLRIETAQIVIRPTLHRCQRFFINSQRKCFASSHVSVQ